MLRHLIHFRKPFAVVALLAVAGSGAAEPEPQKWTPLQREAWRAVEMRWNAWVERDLDAFRAAHHPRWRRWSFAAPPLMATADLEALWTEFQQRERYVGVRLEPVAIEVVEGAGTASVHYVAHGHVRWIGEPFTTATGHQVKRGDEAVIPVRWSDFLVRNEGRWLYLGGYRDGNCGIWPGYGRPCQRMPAE